jgi:ATP-binding cassette subfamily B protein/ATP-binding cassette subfamily C protein
MNITLFTSTMGKLRALLTRTQKWFLISVSCLTDFLAIVETVGISVIMPFISVASHPSLLEGGVYKKIYDFFGFSSFNRAVVAFGGAIILFYLFRSIFTVFYQYALSRFALGMYRHFSVLLFKAYLSIPYRLFVQKNTGEMASIVHSESQHASSLLLNVLQMCSELFMVLLLYGCMVAVNPRMTLALTVILLVSVLILLQTLVRHSRVLGVKRSDAELRIHKIMGQTFGNFKYIKLKGNKDAIFADFDEKTDVFARAQVLSTTLGVMPRSILEGLGFSLLVGAVVFILWRYHRADQVIPIISMYALAFYRILPAVNRMLSNINQMAYLHRSLDVVAEIVALPSEAVGAGPVSFESSIALNGVGFSYLTGEPVLRDVTLEIGRGEKLAITGESGGGKSTLVDLIIGLNRPSVGCLLVDGVPLDEGNLGTWRAKVGYIPQDIYLADASVADNVAFGAPYDAGRIEQVLKMANIWDFLQQKQGADTPVGEMGIQLSGGQRQRIGSARALYGDPEILVLDEATSALDNETEAKIMDEIYQVSHNKTLIVIAHRLTTVERCDRVLRIEGGHVLP